MHLVMHFLKYLVIISNCNNKNNKIFDNYTKYLKTKLFHL